MLKKLINFSDSGLALSEVIYTYIHKIHSKIYGTLFAYLLVWLAV